MAAKPEPDDAKPDRVRCPKCGSTNVRRSYLNRLNIGCVLVNVMAFATLLERPNPFCRVCRNCRHPFVNT